MKSLKKPILKVIVNKINSNKKSMD
jgi:hypothetical protein